VFFLNHCNADRLWAMWQDMNSINLYVPSHDVYGNGPKDLMWPWDGGKSKTEAERLQGRIRDYSSYSVTVDKMFDFRALQFSYDIDIGTKNPLKIGPDPISDSFDVEYSNAHYFPLTIVNHTNYKIYSEGNLDIAFTLFGPALCENCFGTLKANDRDSGFGGINPSVSITLVPGQYYLIVHQSKPTAVGSYKIYIKEFANQKDDGALPLKMNIPYRASISQMWEIDWYSFTITKAGRYFMETKGDSDTLLMLYGDAPPTGLIAQDDDSGEEYNAKISIELKPGKYHLAVRGYGSSVGNYSVLVRDY